MPRVSSSSVLPPRAWADGRRGAWPGRFQKGGIPPRFGRRTMGSVARDPWERARARPPSWPRAADLPTFWGEATEDRAGRAALMSPCWYTLDPATLLAAATSAELDESAEWLATSTTPTTSRHGRRWPARQRARYRGLRRRSGRSARWRANMEMGGDQELLVALRTLAGEAWGILGCTASRASGVQRRRDRVPARRLAVWPPRRTDVACSSGRPPIPTTTRARASWCCGTTGASSPLTPAVARWLDGYVRAGDGRRQASLPPSGSRGGRAGAAQRSEDSHRPPRRSRRPPVRLLAEGPGVLHGASWRPTAPGASP